MDNVTPVIDAFAVKGNLTTYAPFGHGRINSTYILDTDCNKRYVMQQINKNVFKNPDKLMGNAVAVTDYIRKHSDGKYTTLRYVRDKETGLPYHIDQNGEYWRMYEYVPGAGMDVMECDEDFYQCALGFGWFQNSLSDFPASSLCETIPNFHNTPDRYLV